MPSALRTPPQRPDEQPLTDAQLGVDDESANDSDDNEIDEAALAAQIQKARIAAQLSVSRQRDPRIKVTAIFDIEAANQQPQSTAAPVADETQDRSAADDTTPAQSTSAGALPPQTMIPGGMPGGQIPQEAQGAEQEGDEEGAEEREGADDEDSEGADEEGGDEAGDEEAAQQSELERDKADARENQGDEGDEEGGEGEKSAGDEEAENEGLAGAVPNPEEAMVYGSRASLTASFYELPTLLKGNIGPLLYIHMHFLGYYLLPDIPFLALIPILKTKPKFEKPNVFHNIGFMVILFVELLGTVVMIMQLMIPILIIYAIVALTKWDWEQVKGIFSFFSGFELGKTLFGIIKGFF